MKRKAIFIAMILALCLFTNTKTLAKGRTSTAPVFLTVQAENGNILRQLTNKDGTITCVFKPSDVIRINSIILNGSDVTYQLEGYKYTTPVLTKNSTLEINFDSVDNNSFQTRYNTITFISKMPCYSRPFVLGRSYL
jgi:hypothetical protein